MNRTINAITLLGSLTKTPALAYTNGGRPLLRFTIAGNQAIVKNDGTPAELPWYHNLSWIDDLAEEYANTLTNGSVIALSAQIDHRKWTEDGTERTGTFLKTLRFQEAELENPEFITDAKGGLRLRHAINRAEVIGNLTKDVMTRAAKQSGDHVSNASVAMDESWKSTDGQWQQKTHYIEVVAWRELAERLKTGRKGMTLFASGWLNNDSFDDSEGVRRSKLVIETTDTYLLKRPAELAKVRAEAQNDTDRDANETTNSEPLEDFDF